MAQRASGENLQHLVGRFGKIGCGLLHLLRITSAPWPRMTQDSPAATVDTPPAVERWCRRCSTCSSTWTDGQRTCQSGMRAGRVCRRPAPCTCTCPQCVCQHRSAKAVQTLCVCAIASRCRCVCVCDRVYVRVCVCVHKVFMTCLHHGLCVAVWFYSRAVHVCLCVPACSVGGDTGNRGRATRRGWS